MTAHFSDGIALHIAADPTRQYRQPNAGLGQPIRPHISGTKVEGYLDGKLYLQHTLQAPVSGRVGLWSKADSHMYFDAFSVNQSE